MIIRVFSPRCADLWIRSGTPEEGQSHAWPSVLKGDDRVHFVDVVRAVPENPCEVVCVGRVVHLYLVAESSIFGEGVHLAFVIDDLQETNIEIMSESIKDSNSVEFAKYSATNVLIMARRLDKYY